MVKAKKIFEKERISVASKSNPARSSPGNMEPDIGIEKKIKKLESENPRNFRNSDVWFLGPATEQRACRTQGCSHLETAWRMEVVSPLIAFRVGGVRESLERFPRGLVVLGVGLQFP